MKKPKSSSRLNESCFCGSKKKFKYCCCQKKIHFNTSLLISWAYEVNEQNEISSEEGFEVFKLQYSKFVTSFYVDLITKGTQQMNKLIHNYNSNWQNYCSFIDKKFPEMESYFIKNLSKNLNAELTQEN